jgi:hypothetical protein
MHSGRLDTQQLGNRSKLLNVDSDGDSSDSSMVFRLFGADNFGGDAYGCFSWRNV